jgi:hypothetical protein
MVYGISAVLAGAIAYARKRTPAEMLTDSLIHGAALGTAANVTLWLVGESEGVVARENSYEGLGKLSQEAVRLLSGVDTETLFSSMKANGVHVGLAPDDIYVINQPVD